MESGSAGSGLPEPALQPLRAGMARALGDLLSRRSAAGPSPSRRSGGRGTGGSTAELRGHRNDWAPRSVPGHPKP